MFGRLYFHFGAQVLNAFGLVAAWMLWARALENPDAIYWTWRFVLLAFAANCLIGLMNMILAIQDVIARNNAKSSNGAHVKTRL